MEGERGREGRRGEEERREEEREELNPLMLWGAHWQDPGMGLGRRLNDLLLRLAGQVPTPGQEQICSAPSLDTSHLQGYVSGTALNPGHNQIRRAPVCPSLVARCLAQGQAHISPPFLSARPQERCSKSREPWPVSSSSGFSSLQHWQPPPKASAWDPHPACVSPGS